MLKKKMICVMMGILLMGILTLIPIFSTPIEVLANSNNNVPLSANGHRLQFNRWYYMRNETMSRGGLQLANGWVRSYQARNLDGIRIRFAKHNNQNATGSINFGDIVRIERQTTGARQYMGRLWRRGNWFVFNRAFSGGSDFLIKNNNSTYGSNLSLVYRLGWGVDFVNTNRDGYLYLREGTPHAWSFVPVTTHELTLQRNIATGGALPAAGLTTLEPGQTTEITARPNSGYRFVRWGVTGAGSSVNNPTNPTATFTMGTANATVRAYYERITQRTLIK